MELRIHGEVGAIETPAGFIPLYEDLKELFQFHLDKDYTSEEYNAQFATRVPELLDKIGRIEKIYQETVEDSPELLFELLDEQRTRLLEVQKELGEYILPSTFK